MFVNNFCGNNFGEKEKPPCQGAIKKQITF
jgi:hypothetical protein